ncbi:hypothetical protein PBSP11A_000168200 [Plasmodium berghei]|uniref:Cyclic nucleotide-binding domain-containing protein n=1 Tax=Plasmodium berghei TaxID=5821 RepID=A0A1D3SD50_PLABE|nr:hypothetical protein PBSP11A_000168200 [Plasmodium berghei]
MPNWNPNQINPQNNITIDQTKQMSNSGKIIMETNGVEHSDTESEYTGELDKYSQKIKQENFKDSTIILISDKKNKKKIEPINYKNDIINFLKESIYFKYIDTHLMNKYIHGTTIYTLNKNEYLLKDNTFLNYAIIIIKGKVKNIKENTCTNGDKCFIGLEALGPCNIIELFNSIIEKRINVIKNYQEKKKKKKRKKKKKISMIFKKKRLYEIKIPTKNQKVSKNINKIINTNLNIIEYILNTDCEYILLSKNEYMDMIIESYENNKVDEMIENS